jgi:hypothetical protein
MTLNSWLESSNYRVIDMHVGDVKRDLDGQLDSFGEPCFVECGPRPKSHPGTTPTLIFPASSGQSQCRDNHSRSAGSSHSATRPLSRSASSAHYDDCDHPLRSIATTCYDRLRPVKAPLGPLGDSQYSEMASSGVEAVPVVNRRDPRALRSAPTADAAARAGGPC